MSDDARLPALSHPNFRRYLIGTFTSNVGNMAQGMAVSWQVYEITNSVLMVGLLGAVRVAPLVLLSLFGGVIADQFDRRNVLLVTQSIMMLSALAFAALTISGQITVGWIYGLVAFAACARSFDGPARQSLLVHLVPERHLPNAISLNGMGWRLSDVLGPIIAGTLIAQFSGFGISGLGWVYLLNGATFIVLLAVLLSLPPASPFAHGEVRQKASVESTLRLIREGIDFVRRTPVVRSAMLIDFWATFFSAADALLPALAKDVLSLGPQGFGILMGSSGMGALIAATTMAWIRPIQQQGLWVIRMVALYGLFTILLGVSNSLWVAVLCLAATGAADMVSTVLRQTIRQLATPNSMRGRMTAIGSIFQISGPQLGDFESGVVASFTGVRFAIVVGGVFSLGIAALWMRGKDLRDYRFGDHAK